ncbi:hypothetical protein V12B01_13225 [Vibrio splendidus 12B01]|nr:hypothetical protein V12B01_13225 [Vibrio splendidus 12B01]
MSFNTQLRVGNRVVKTSTQCFTRFNLRR